MHSSSFQLSSEDENLQSPEDGIAEAEASAKNLVMENIVGNPMLKYEELRLLERSDCRSVTPVSAVRMLLRMPLTRDN